MKKIISIVAILLCLLLAIGALVWIANSQGDLSTGITSFYVYLDGTKVDNEASFEWLNNKIEVVSLIDKVTNSVADFSYKVVCNPVGSSVTIKANGKKYPLSYIEDYTRFFDIVKDGNILTLNPTSFKEVLQEAFNAETIVFPENFDQSDKYFSLVITLEDNSIVLNFSLPKDGFSLQLDKTEIIF